MDDLNQKINELENRIQYLEDLEKKRKRNRNIRIIITIVFYILILVSLYFVCKYLFNNLLNNGLKGIKDILNLYTSN